jgi:hypothetical protein
LAENVNGAQGALLETFKIHLTTPQIRDMIASTEPMFYSARAAARAQKETFLCLHGSFSLRAAIRALSIPIEGGVPFRFMLAPYA